MAQQVTEVVGRLSLDHLGADDGHRGGSIHDLLFDPRGRDHHLVAEAREDVGGFLGFFRLFLLLCGFRLLLFLGLGMPDTGLGEEEEHEGRREGQPVPESGSVQIHKKPPSVHGAQHRIALRAGSASPAHRL